MDVLMVHKDFPDRTPVSVTLTAFQNVWAANGWELADGGPAYEEEGTAPLLEEKTLSELKKLAAEFEIEGRSSMSKEELIAAIEDDPDYAAGEVGSIE